MSDVPSLLDAGLFASIVTRRQSKPSAGSTPPHPVATEAPGYVRCTPVDDVEVFVMAESSSSDTVPPENYELWDEEREELRCPFCDGRILRIGTYGECTECGERFEKQGPEADRPEANR